MLTKTYITLALLSSLLLTACQSTVKLESPDKPIDINVTIKEDGSTTTTHITEPKT